MIRNHGINQYSTSGTEDLLPHLLLLFIRYSKQVASEFFPRFIIGGYNLKDIKYADYTLLIADKKKGSYKKLVKGNAKEYASVA